MKKALLILSLLFLTHDAWAATKTWQNGGVDNNYSTAGNWVEGSKPAAGDDVVIGAAYNMTVDEATAAVQSWDMTGYANTMSGSATINVRNTAATTVNCIMRGASGYTGLLGIESRNASSTILIDIGSYGGSVTLGNVSSDSGTYTVTTNTTLPSTRTLTLSFGTLHIDGATDNAGLTHSIGAFSSSNSNTRRLYAGNANITCTSAGAAFNFGTSTGLTVTPGNASLTLSGAGANFIMSGGGGTWYDLTLSGSGTAIINSTNSISGITFNSVIRNGSAAKTDALQINNPITVTSTLTLSGNSAINRLLFTSNSIGTARVLTINSTTVSTNNVDFRDITFARTTAGGLDLTNGGANLIGDCGGNTRTGGDGTVTFTTPATQTATGSSANWSTATWTSRVPLPQDDVVISLTAGQTITSDMPRLGKSISFTTATNWTQTLAHTMYGSLDLTGMGTLTESSSSLDLEGRTSGLTVTSAGKSHTRAFRIASVGGVYTFQDAFSSTNQLQHSYGTLTVNNVNIQASSFTNNILTSTRVMNMGSGTWTLTGTGTIWSMFTTSFTLNSETSTIISSDVSVTAKTFSGQSLVYNNFSITGGGSGAVTITGSNTFNTLTIGSPKTVTFTSGTTQTVSNFVATGTAGNVITINSSSAGSAATLTKSGGGTVSCDYLSLRDNTGSPANTWYYGNNSTVVSNVNGWNSGNPPSGQAYNMLLGVG